MIGKLIAWLPSYGGYEFNEFICAFYDHPKYFFIKWLTHPAFKGMLRMAIWYFFQNYSDKGGDLNQVKLEFEPIPWYSRYKLNIVHMG